MLRSDLETAEEKPVISAADFAKAIRAGDDRDFSGHVVEGDVDLVALDHPRPLTLRNLVFRGRFDTREARVARSVDLSGCTFAAGLDLSLSRIDGHLLLAGATIQGDPKAGQAARFDHVRIEGDLLGSSLKSDLTLGLRRACVAGDVILKGVALRHDLNLEQAVIEGNLRLRPEGNVRSEVGDGILLHGARVAGTVFLDGAKVGGRLLLQAAEVGGALFCRAAGGHCAEVGGDAWLAGAKVAGELNLDGAKVGGHLLLQAAQVGGSLLCGAAGGHRAEVGGDADLNVAEISGLVVFNGAKIGGELNLRDAKVRTLLFGSKDGHPAEVAGEIDFEKSTIDHVRLGCAVGAEGRVNFSQARFRELEILDTLPANRDIEGLEYEQITLPGGDYLAFVEGAEPFHKGAFVFMEAYLRDRGLDAMADQVYRHMRRLDRKSGSTFPGRLGDWVLEKTIGYGTQTHRLLIYFLVAIGMATWLFSSPRAVERDVVVTASDVAAGHTDPSPIFPGPDDWSVPRAIWLAMRMNLPLLTLMSDDDWRPSPEWIPVPFWSSRHLPITYENFAAFESALGWIFLPLFLAGISGFVKKKE